MAGAGAAAGDLEAAYARAVRVATDDILTAYYDDEQCRRIVEVLLDAIPAQRTPRDGLTLRGVRDALTMRHAAAAAASAVAATAMATATAAAAVQTATAAAGTAATVGDGGCGVATVRVALPSFQELDAHLRAFAAHRWVVAWVDPATQMEHFSAPVQCVIDAFRESARAEVAVYEQRTAAVATGALFQCTACGALRPLLDVLAFHRRAASASAAAAAASGSLAPSYCTTCTRTGTVVELGPLTRDDHLRIAHVVAPLLRSLDALEAAARALDTAARQCVQAARAPPVLVRARLLRVRGSSTGRTELNCDVYIGVDRSAKDARLRVTQWGPPWSAGAHTARGGLGLTVRDADAYRREVSASPDMLRALPSLAGKRLGCSCRSVTGGDGGDGGGGSSSSGATKYVCHGHVLVELFRFHCM